MAWISDATSKVQPLRRQCPWCNKRTSWHATTKAWTNIMGRITIRIFFCGSCQREEECLAR